jgi:hypothetical protein
LLRLIQFFRFRSRLPQIGPSRSREDECMAIATDLRALVEELAARLESINLNGDDQEEYSSMLCRLENQADREEPNYAIVVECVAYFGRDGVISATHAA